MIYKNEGTKTEIIYSEIIYYNLIVPGKMAIKMRYITADCNTDDAKLAFLSRKRQFNSPHREASKEYLLTPETLEEK